MATTLTNVQRAILAAAAARDSGDALPIPDTLTLSAGTRAIVLKALRAKGFLAAVDDDPTALAISPAGLEAITDNAAVRPEAAAQAPKPLSAARARTVRERPAKPAHETKQSLVIALLRRGEGASIADICAATGWQPHSVRGFLSGALKKRLGLVIISEKDAGGERRYYIAALKPSEG